MAEISTLSGLEGTQITEEQLLALIRRCDIALNNLLFGGGTWGAVDYQEFGPAGHKTTPSVLIEQIRKTREMWMHLLNHPEERGDYAFYISQWDDPAL